MKFPLFVIGYMASGKTTFGKALADATRLDFVDLDELIEISEGMSVSMIFKNFGEKRFRDIEKRILHSIAGKDRLIVACGGGTPCYFDNMDFMNANGTTLWLDTSLPVLLRRLKEDNANRPLLAGKSDSELLSSITSQIEKRKPFYSKSQLRLNGDKLENANEINETVSSFLQRIPLS